MRIFDLISMTMRNLLRRKARTLLTMTGVVVGTCAIVVMISLGLAMTKAMEESLAQMGDLTQITIQNYGSSKDKPKLNDDALKQIQQIEDFITKKVDAIIMSPCDPVGSQACVGSHSVCQCSQHEHEHCFRKKRPVQDAAL